MTFKLVYVCYANKGRSPAFEAYTKHFLEETDLDIEVRSGGVGHARIEQLRREGHTQASRQVRKILHEEELLSIDDFIMHNVEEVGRNTDLFLMSDEHTLELFAEEHPIYAKRAQLAGDYAHSPTHREVYGPHHSSRGPLKSELDGYRHMLKEIKYLSRRVVNQLESELLVK